MADKTKHPDIELTESYPNFNFLAGLYYICCAVTSSRSAKDLAENLKKAGLRLENHIKVLEKLQKTASEHNGR